MRLEWIYALQLPEYQESPFSKQVRYLIVKWLQTSLAKSLIVLLRTKWLWVRGTFLSLNHLCDYLIQPNGSTTKANCWCSNHSMNLLRKTIYIAFINNVLCENRFLSMDIHLFPDSWVLFRLTATVTVQNSSNFLLFRNHAFLKSYYMHIIYIWTV